MINYLLFLFVLLDYDSLFTSALKGGELRCLEREREALMRFKKALIDEDDILSSWGSEEPKKECCKWRGIKCDNETGHVIALQLNCENCNTPLRGKISSALLELNYLTHLDLSYIDFGYVDIPEFIGSMERLQYLNLTQSNFSGIIPNLRPLVSLKELHLKGNKLKMLHTSLWQLLMLEILDVSFNTFEGIISDADLSNLQNLKVLDLSFNSLVLNFSSDWIPPFQLQAIKLASCNMGPHFPTWLQTQTNFSELDLSWTGISNEVPEWLWDLSSGITYLNLSHNHIGGKIPDMSSSYGHNSIIDISSNNFSGYLPLFHPNSLILELSNNMFVGSLSSICAVSFNWLSFLDLSNNQLSGELPDCWNNMTKLSILNLANNKLSGYLPHSLGSLWWLHALHLRDNNFSGELPSTLRNCHKLVVIDVGQNELTGNIPAWIGTHFKALRFLSLGHNRFYGSIPLEICYLTEIQILDLSGNSISGRIPQCFYNFTSLVQKNRLSTGGIFLELFFDAFYLERALVQWKGQEKEYRKTLGLLTLIDLSSNKLIGSIPDEFSNFKKLISLNLSRNHLSGNIISNINEMEMLECLDLSRNQFSGEIPVSLAELHFLVVLDLSNNNLSGKIPSSTQLQGFDASMYAGNIELCGHPLASCPGDGPNPSVTDYGKQDNDDGEDDGVITLGFIISIVLGFILGFWGVVGTLVLKNSWRYAYFNLFDMIRDWLYMTTTIHVMRLRSSLRANTS